MGVGRYFCRVVKNYRPLLLQELNVRMPGVRLRRLRLNRHLPEVDAVSKHGHGFSQILCYLGGSGTMSVQGRGVAIGPGSVIFVPPRILHSFQETTGRRPLCLVIDLDWRGAARAGVRRARLAQSRMGSVRGELSQLTRLEDANVAACRLVVAAAVLRIADVLLRELGLVAPLHERVAPIVRRFDQLLRRPQHSSQSMPELAAQLGYQSDHLNRVVKRATGQTLRQYRDTLQLERAKRLLRENRRVSGVGEMLGFDDPNYFSRWFRKHTGVAPRSYQTSMDAPRLGEEMSAV